jgi:hypothetical protein
MRPRNDACQSLLTEKVSPATNGPIAVATIRAPRPDQVVLGSRSAF